MRGAATARVGELHMIELDGRRDIPNRRSACGVGYTRLGVEQVEDGDRRRLRHHALVHQRTHFTERTIHLDSHHQNDQQHLQTHRPVDDAVHAQRQSGRRANRNARIGDSA